MPVINKVDDSERPDEVSPVLGMNSMMATAVRNATDFAVPMWALSTDGLEKHRPATDISSSFLLKTDGSSGSRDLKPSVIGVDQRQKVDAGHLAPGGKYRSVVKLSLVFRRNGRDVKMMGTGWLIQNDLIVTAGHCVYDKAFGMGQVKSIVAYLGYKGVNSLESHSRVSSDVEIAYGRCVATTMGWIQDLGRQYDLAWIKLDRKFRQTGKNDSPIDWTNTPFQAISAMVGIVGYAGDKSLDGEYGAEMYECWLPTTFSLMRNNMIQYEIDSNGGQSGAPVFYSLDDASIDPNTNAPYRWVNDLEAKAIGAHTYGGQINAGTPIGPYGVPMNRYLDVINRDVRLTGSIRFVPDNAPEGYADPTITNGFDPIVFFDGEAYSVRVPFADEQFGLGDLLSIGTKVLGGFFEAGDEEDDALRDEASVEGFLDFLRKAAATITRTDLPMVLGPAGVPVSIVASSAIITLGQSLQKKKSGQQNQQPDRKKELYRGALAEAVLDACCKHHKVLEEEGLFDHFKKWHPVGVRVASVVASAFSDFAEETSNPNTVDAEWLASRGLSWDVQENSWAWDTQPANPNSTTSAPSEGILSALPHGDRYQEFGETIGSENQFPGIKWTAIETSELRLRQSLVTKVSQQSRSNPLTDQMQIVTTMRALAGVMLLSAVENATPDQVKTLNSEGFFMDTTATLKKLLHKFGDKLVCHGPHILDAVNKIVQNSQKRY